MSSGLGYCILCHKFGPLDAHHRFPQTKWAKKLYGQLIHDMRNIQIVGNCCHASHNHPGLTHWTEREFCLALGIEPRSKTERSKK